MRRALFTSMVSALLMVSSAEAATFTFNTDPFAGSTALTMLGRQIVGGEPSIIFNPATDAFVFDPTFFAITDPLAFASGPAASLPTSGAEVIILQEFGPPMNAGLAANLIAGRVTSPSAGVFVYFNTGLDLLRLVYSTNLDDETADLKILARMTNLNGQAGRDAMATFTAGNFDVPEPVTMLLFGLAVLGAVRRRS